MRILLDANVLISYLLSPTPTRAVAQVVELAFTDDVELVLAKELVDETTRSITSSPYLRSRIPLQQINAFLVRLLDNALIPTELAKQEWAVRDPKDRYLLTYAVNYAVDFLITGDKDLLVLGQVENVRILTPAQFLDLYPQR